MTLPDTLIFDHTRLQDFADCPRRFYLRYIQQLRYPAPESASLRALEAHTERDAQFRRLVHQHTLGIPAQALAATISDPVVAAWWDAYLKAPPPSLPLRRLPEVTLTAPLAGRRLAAHFDLLALDAERAVIVEWHTAPERPSRAQLQRRLQTAVYPYLLARAGAHLNGGAAISPETITLLYWFPEQPEKPEIFPYSTKQYRADGEKIESLAADILRRSDSEFELTDNLELCQFCAYRSLNDRGVKAGDLLAAGGSVEKETFAIDLRLDQTSEAGI